MKKFMKTEGLYQQGRWFCTTACAGTYAQELKLEEQRAATKTAAKGSSAGGGKGPVSEEAPDLNDEAITKLEESIVSLKRQN